MHAHVLPASYIVAWLSGQGLGVMLKWPPSIFRMVDLVGARSVVHSSYTISNYTVIMHVHAAVWIDQPTPLKIIALGPNLSYPANLHASNYQMTTMHAGALHLMSNFKSSLIPYQLNLL